ncbi:MAG: TonB-dependent receptor [Flavobacteriaceae bacterium]|nr:TonB-dependent receptor [Flavobacteriaceae bacterium]
MKYFLCIALFFSCFQLFSQNQNQVTVAFSDVSIPEAINKIESASSLKFYYLNEWFGNERVSGNYTNQSIESILNDVFKNTVINFFIYKGKSVILTKNNVIYDTLSNAFFDVIPENERDREIEVQDEDKVVSNPVFYKAEEVVTVKETDTITPVKIGKEEKTPTQEKYNLTGFIRNDKGEPLSNISVSVQGKDIGTTTDNNGFYSLELNTGTYTIVTSSLSTKRARKRVVLYNDGVLNFNLEESFETLDEVLIEAEVDKNVRETITGLTKIDVEEIKNIPLVLGERDILKVATTLPGIAVAGEGSNGYNVRGGKTDQNLILLDDAAIYNPSHLFGIFSAINPFTTGEVNIYKGNLPSEYGGRLSSVFDISSKDANTKEFAGEVSVGPVTGNVTLELPVVKDKAGIMVGGRAAYAGWILRSLDEEQLKNSEASFYDVILKYNHKLSEKDDFRTSAYYSSDRFSITSDSIYGYSNRLFSVGWEHEINAKHDYQVTLSNSEYKFDIEYDGDFTNDFDLNYKNTETELKLKFNYKHDDEKRFNYGISAKLYGIEPGEVNPLGPESVIEAKKVEKEKGLETALFVSSDIELSEKFAIDAGLRYSFYSFLGSATQRTYTAGLPKSDATLEETLTFGNNEFIKTYGGLEARLSARYFLAEDFSVKGSYNNTFQYIHTLSTNTTVSPTDTWKLSDMNIKPQKAQQFALGFYKNFQDNMYEFSLEGYYKTYNDILDYKVGAQLLLNERLETEVLQGEGRAYGIEFLIKKNKGVFNGWLGYTYSKSEVKLDSQFAEERVNGGDYFPANYDKPHDFSVVANYKLTRRFSFSGNFAYQTGRPVTYPVGTYVFNGAEYVLYSDRNKFRIPDYYRLDIGFNYEGNHKIKKFAHSFWNISIYNVLGRNNPYSVYFVTEDGQVKAYQSSIFSIPIPTITYNFKF